MIVTLFADFNNTDKEGRVRFTNGTEEDVRNANIQLKQGLKIILNNYEGLSIEGIVEFSKDENIWVMKYDHGKLVDTHK